MTSAQTSRSSLASRVAADLRRALENGEVAEDGRLPAEPDLARMFGVSRTSIREAVVELEEQGFVRRRQGSGTYLHRDPATLRNNLNANSGVTELIEAAGWTPGTRDVSRERRLASPEEALLLGLKPGDPVLVLERVRTADERPVVFTLDVIPLGPLAARGLTADALEAVIGAKQSLYRALESLGLVVQHGEAEIRPAQADRRLATELGIEPGSLLLRILQVDFTSDDRAVLLSDERHVADAFSIRVYRKGSGRMAE